MNQDATKTAPAQRGRSEQSQLRNFQVVAILLLCSSAFGQPAKSAADKAPSAFVVVPGAINVTHFHLQGGRKQLSYRLQADYPAQSVLDIIKHELRERKWLPLPVDYLNPDIPSSYVRGWDYYEDHATEPRTSVQVWQADWRRDQEIVTYRLEYRCPDNLCASTSNLHELRMIVIYDPHPMETRR